MGQENARSLHPLSRHADPAAGALGARGARLAVPGPARRRWGVAGDHLRPSCDEKNNFENFRL